MPGLPDTPGVYIQRDDRSRAGVSVVRTDVTGFVGIAEKGPLGRPVRIETMRQFETVFGGYLGSAFLAYSVRAFFENGGRRCLVVRVAAGNPATGAAPAIRSIPDTGGGPGLEIAASSPGSWGNGLTVTINTAWRAETVAANPPVAATALAVAATEGFAAGQLVRLSQPGLAEQYRILAAVDPGARLLHFVHPEPASRRATDRPLAGLLPGAPVRIERLDYDLAVSSNGLPVALYAGLSLVPGGPRYVADVLRPVEPDDDGVLPGPPPPLTVTVPERPAGEIPLPLAVVPGVPLALAGGRDGLGELSPADFKAGLAALEDQRDLSILAVPDILIEPLRRPVLSYDPPTLDPCVPCPPPPAAAEPLPPPLAELPPRFGEAAIAEVQAAMLEQCERLRDRVALVDPPWRAVRGEAVGLGAVQAWRSRFDSAFGALYLPWLAVPDPLGLAPTRMIPPSGHVAGQIAATDIATGPHRAAANSPLAWAQAASLEVGAGGHGLLNSAGLNVIAARDGRPLRILGARTMSSDPAWRFLPVRRFVSMLRRALDAATQWAVFEPNSAETRALLAQSIGIFLESLRRGGALAGDRPAEAFRVRCDETNNPPSARAVGELLVDIAVAPARPLEFILLRLGRREEAFELAEQGALALDSVGAA
ncbi:MAG: phage tail sheath C-terminal domain-containing protein [Tistlia sp.]|uniref:phage tail sheath family protein n=1 Tax=Tistlia sp. TaxID=3057121 RepID=UPI0034A2AF38